MKVEEVREFPLDKLDLEDETFQARFSYSERKIRNLAEDIKQYGQREPIGVKESPKENGKFQIIYGFQRVKACKLLGRDTIKATVYEANDEECRELCVRDNEMHGDLSQVEKALQCQRLKEKHGWSVDRLCEAFNAKKSTIYNWLKVANLDDVTLGLIHHGYLTVYQGLELSKFEDDSRRLETTKEAVGWNWSVRGIRKWRTTKTSPTMLLPLGEGWIDNCWKDLRMKDVKRECRKCEYFKGVNGVGDDRRLECKASEEVPQPPVIEKFLREVGWEEVVE